MIRWRNAYNLILFKEFTMNHKLLYVLILVFVISVSQIKAMEKDKNDEELALIELINKTSQKVALLTQYPDNYVVAKSMMQDDLGWPLSFGIVKKDKDSEKIGDPCKDDYILDYPIITELDKKHKKYTKDMNAYKEEKQKNQPESQKSLLGKGVITTLLPIGSLYGFCKIYPQIYPKGILLKSLFWTGVFGVGVIGLVSIHYGFKKLGLAYNYKQYKNDQHATIADYSRKMLNIQTNFLTPIGTIFDKLDEGIKNKNAIQLSQK